MASTFLRLTVITEGATEKVSQFATPLKSACHKTNVLMKKNVFLSTEDVISCYVMYVISFMYGAQKLTGGNLKVFLEQFSTLS
jgi:hypothetical protein